MGRSAPYVFVGGVDVGYACLEALCEMGLAPQLAVGYDESRAHASGFRDLGPLAERHGFPLVRTPDVNDSGLVEPTLELLAKRAGFWLTAEATVVVKHFWRDDPPERVGTLSRTRQKRFGETVLSYYTRAA